MRAPRSLKRPKKGSAEWRKPLNPAADGGRYDRRQPAVSDSARRASLIPQSWPLAEHQGPTPFRRPPYLQMRFGPISLERGDIFQHKGHAMLTCLEDALQVASKMAPRRNLTSTSPNLGPSWPHLGPQDRPGIPPRSPKRPPRGPQETP